MKGDETMEPYPLKIDAYSHIRTEKYNKVFSELFQGDERRALTDLDHRFRIMDQFEPLVQVLTTSMPPVERVAGPEKAVGLAKLANDGMAELVLKYPERFVAAIACIPMNDIDAALEETDRAINDLRFRGVQVASSIDKKPLDTPEFLPLFEKMHQYDLPIYIHPVREPTQPDYETEDASKYAIYSLFGWPYETTVAMTRLVFSGILEKYPNLKVITHHCGGMVPYFEERIKGFYDLFEIRGSKDKQPLRKDPIEYFKKFYNDTAIYGNTPALMCANDFCGADHLLFAVDSPLGDSQGGFRNYRQTINAIDRMDIDQVDKKKIYEDNARHLLRLPI
jgi:predicted TIM-barrel fold metal-dependent hydrolase